MQQLNNQWSRRTYVKSVLVFKPIEPKEHSAEHLLNANAIILAKQIEKLQLWLTNEQNYHTLVHWGGGM